MASSRPPAKGSPTKRTSAKRPKTPSALARTIAGVKGWFAQGLKGRNAEVWGLALIVVALIATLGIVADLAGPVGRLLRDQIGNVVGILRLVVPLALLWWGVTLLRSRSTADGARLGFGLGLLVVAATGMAHLLRGPDSVSAPIGRLRDAGGYLGSVVAIPLEALTAAPGAWLILLVVAVLGALIALDIPLSTAAGAVVRSLRVAWRRTIGWLRSLGRVGEQPTVAADDEVPIAGDRPVGEEPTVAVPAAMPDPEPPRIEMLDEADGSVEQLAIDLDSGRARGAWKLPPLRILRRRGAHKIDHEAVRAGAASLERALASHGVETKVSGMTVGPTVTRYEIELAPGVKVAQVTSLSRDIAYAMAAADVRILAPIPGKSAIGVEVPNSDRQIVTLGDILSGHVAAEVRHPLEAALGQDISGRSAMLNLARMPHVLIAGATGAGKSSCINALLCSILMRSTPDQVRMILIDPKRVELTHYDRLPHLLTSVVTAPKRAANALGWAVKEMEGRYEVLSRCGFRDIDGYNQAVADGVMQPDPGSDDTFEAMPYILVVVDELNDLMMVAARDVEDSICRLAQMARAVGIHLVIATQRPSVNVITGVIKANVPSRIAFAVSSLADSRVIIDQPGAERLVGQGDMLLVTSTSNIPQRLQGCWVSEAEISAITAAWRRQSPQVRYVEGVEGSEDSWATVPGGSTGDEDDDDLLMQAMQLIVETQLGSTSMLQRKLKVGFARAGRLMDLLEQRGVVGPSIGSKARDVLMTPDELEELLARR